MSSLPVPSSHVARIVLGTIAAVALLAAMSAVAEPAAITSEHFAPGWQAHATPLFDKGVAMRIGRDRWYVPLTLPRGDYVLISRTGDTAEVIPGRNFRVTGDMAERYVFLDPSIARVEAIPASDVPSVKVRSPGDKVR